MTETTAADRPGAAPGGDSTPAAELLTLLRDWEVDYVFTCPGSTEAALLDASVRTPRPAVVLTTHESIAVAMADGYARVTGRPTVAYLHTNLGVANGLAHLSAAALAHSPVVILNGLKHAATHGRAGFTTSPAIRDHARQYVKWDWQTLVPAALLEDANRALTFATNEPAGPTWLGITEDMLDGPLPDGRPEPHAFAHRSRVRPAVEELDRAADALRRCRRPVIVAGSEVARAGANAAAVELAELLGAPLMREDIYSLERRVVAPDHPLYAGAFAAERDSVRHADLVFFLGARCLVEFSPAARPPVPASATFLHAHPNAEEVGRTYGVDVPLVGDASLILEALLERLRPDSGDALVDRREQVQRARAEVVSPGTSATVDTAAVPVEEVGAALDHAVSAGDIVVCDATTARSPLVEAITKPVELFSSSSGSLGWGVGAALGAALAAHDRRVYALLGDGVFQFGLPGLWTAARKELPVTFVVCNNQSYAAVAKAVRRYGGQASALPYAALPGVDISGPDIAMISEGFGVPATRVVAAPDLPDALASAQNAAGPRTVEVRTVA